MKVLLVSGLGPYRHASDEFVGTLFDPDFSSNADLQRQYAKLVGRPGDLRQMRYGSNGSSNRLLRPKSEREPCLSTVTLTSILEAHDIDYDTIDIEALVYESAEAQRTDYDVVCLSTTFLCSFTKMSPVTRWIDERFPSATLVVGGQFSNLKYAKILRTQPEVDYVIRGDAEMALPTLLQALEGKKDLSKVPNLVGRDADGGLHMNPFEYVDIEAYPSPRFRAEQVLVPYESMRGCPFTCKYCSYPAASPKWRFKSADKIVNDWKFYVAQNGAKLIAAMDSTFTIPPPRLSRLLELLPEAGVRWYAYSRANTVKTRDLVKKLEDAHCIALAIGFESMNDDTLLAMDKKVRARENRRANELLADSEVQVGGSFIVGYPGETPEAYEDTHSFITRELRGRYVLSVFGVVDETMPVWEDADKYQLEETEEGWKHCGMDFGTAIELRTKTVYDARWNNDDTVLVSWQGGFENPLAPGAGIKRNNKIEKLVERLAFVPKDWGDDGAAVRRTRAILDDLEGLGVHQEPAHQAEPAG